MSQESSPLPLAGASERANDHDESNELLDTPLAKLELPTRMIRWASRAGILRLSELLRFSPAELLEQRNLGRKSIGETRDIIEQRLGSSWEELHRRLSQRGFGSHLAERPLEPEERRIPAGWDDLRVQMSPATQEVSLELLELPTRMRNFVEREGLQTVSELVAIPRSRLVNTKNLARKSLAQTFNVLIELHHRSFEEPKPPLTLEDFVGFFDVWQRHQAELEPLDRLVLSQRAGFQGPSPTLQQLGDMFNLSRERIRQIESRSIASLQKTRWWIDACQARLEAILDFGIRSFEEVERADPFFQGIEERSETFSFFLNELSGNRLHIVDWNGRLLLGPSPQSAWDASFRQICASLSSSSFPISRSEIESRLRSELGELPSTAFDYIWEGVRPLLFFDPDEETVMGFGRSRDAEVSAFLLGTPNPIRIAELIERFGRGRLPDDLIFIDRGLVGKAHHLSDYDLWAKRLPKVCAALMHRIAPERQFTTGELVEALREEAPIPQWLNAWTLGSILRNSHEVRYLGRNVAALPEVEGDRVHIRQLFVSILEEAGRPLSASEILARGAEHRGTSGLGGERQLLSRPPFIATDEGCVGLVARDLPGGEAALVEAAEALSTELEARQQGMLALEMIRFVRALSSRHRDWTPSMVRSVAHHDARLRLVSNGSLGLSEWGEVRAPNRRDIVAALVEEYGGRLPVELALDRIEASFGVRSSRRSLGCLAYSMGAKMTGDFVVRADLVSPHGSEAEALRIDLSTLPGFPAEAKSIFEALLNEPIGDLDALLRDVDSHLAHYEREALGNEFLDPKEAHELAELCRNLVARLANEPHSQERQLVWAAVRYFTIDDDGSSDFMIGGLDDDRAVLESIRRVLEPAQ